MANQWLFDAGNFIAKRNRSLITNYPFRLAKFAWKVVADLAFDYRWGDVNTQYTVGCFFIVMTTGLKKIGIATT